MIRPILESACVVTLIYIAFHHNLYKIYIPTSRLLRYMSLYKYMPVTIYVLD